SPLDTCYGGRTKQQVRLIAAPARSWPKLFMRARLCGSVSGRYRTEENFLLTKHVVAAGTFAKDAGSTPAASSLRSSAARTKTAAPEPAFWGEGGPYYPGHMRSNYDS